MNVSNLLTVEGRILPQPKVSYKGNNVARVAFASWNLANVQFVSARSLPKWSYVALRLADSETPWGHVDNLKPLVDEFAGTLTARGIATQAAMRAKEQVLHSEDDPQIKTLMQQAAGAGIRLLLVVLPYASTALYDQIKLNADKIGVHTVCVVGSLFMKEQGQQQYFSNVALKFNLKLGGINHVVESARLGMLSEDKTMVVGIDVTHPSPGSSSNAPSVAAMVANIDTSFSQWPGILRLQSEPRKEMVSDLGEMLKSRLNLWMTKGNHKNLPENILVYRDGVSEGQYQTVVDVELPLLRAACADVYPPEAQKKNLPRISIVIASKRHHTRFYPTQQVDADRSNNSKPGTIVDRGITEARNWDFYLQSHAAIQGTARPTHYFVVLDEIFQARYAKNLPPGFRNIADVLEDVTQALCYTFGRATKGVSLCSPAYYADILCERARRYLKDFYDGGSAAPSTAGGEGQKQPTNADVTVHENLRNTMFYI